MRRALRDAGALLGIALLTGALLAFTLLYQREAALRSGEQLTESLSRVISEQTARTLQSADQTLRLSVVRLEALRAAGTLDEPSARAVLRDELQGVAFLRAIWVVDMQGRVVLDSGEGRNVGTFVGDRPYFQVYQRAPQTGFFIGPPLRSRANGAWMVTVARPVRGSDGAVRQVIAAALEPPYFEHLWRGIDLGSSGAVVLYHRSGQLLARSPMDERLRGRDFSQLPIFREYLPQSPQGTFIRESGIDGVRRVVAYRQLANYPDLLVAVGSGYDEMLASWRRFAALTSAVFAAAVLVALALTLQLRRQARRREQTEERFRRLAQAVPQIVFIADVRGAVQYITPRWQEVTGRTHEEALGSRWQQQVHPEDRERMVDTLARMVASGQEVHVEHRLRQADGSYRWQLLRALPVHEGGTQAVSWFGTCTDIDELKQAQERLLQQAEQLRIAGRLTRMGSWRVDLKTQRVALSEEVAAVLDLPPDVEPPVAQLVAMVAPESAPQAMEALRRCAEEGEPFDLELEMVTPTGRHVWIRTIGEAIRDDEGRVVAVQGAQQEITLRMLMMEEIRRLNASLEERITQRTGELARQEALFRTLAEQAPLPIWTIDPQGRATFLSAAFYELFGGAPPDWHGEAWIGLLHPDDLLDVQQNWIRSMTTGAPFAGTRRMRGRDGNWHTMRYRALPVRDPQGAILFWVGVESDITDLIAKESALRLANKQLESFSYSVSHDLQSPLQRVAQFARLLQDELAVHGTAGKARHYLERIQANAATMSQLIEGLLALAHVSEVEVIRSAVNLSDMASDILQRLQADHPQRHVQWVVEPGLAVTGDARLMRSVLENLIGNAWKFTGGQPVAEITVAGSRERGEYFVRDNGCGFDMAYADRLFGTFQRLHGDDEFPGTGIGLATVARAISRQGGRVWARSAPAEGATFYFTLPPA